jgi:hypothetical protein
MFQMLLQAVKDDPAMPVSTLLDRYVAEQEAGEVEQFADKATTATPNPNPMKENSMTNAPAGAVHAHFGLSYANYLVLPRTLMQSMPVGWQERMVAVLDELDDAFRHVPQAEAYKVEAATESEGFEGEVSLVPAVDPVPHYNRGRTYVAPRIGESP